MTQAAWAPDCELIESDPNKSFFETRNEVFSLFGLTLFCPQGNRKNEVCALICILIMEGMAFFQMSKAII